MNPIILVSCTALTADGRAVSLAQDKDGSLWGATHTAGEAPAWQPLNAEAPAELRLALHARDGRMVAMARREDGMLVQRWFAPEQLQPWRWEPMDGHTDRATMLVERATGGLEAFLIDDAGVLYHRWTNREFQWSEWSTLESAPCEHVCVVNNVEGFPQAYVRLATGEVAVRRHLNNGTWNEWNHLGGACAKGPFATVDADGMAVVFVENAEGWVWQCRQTAIDAYGPWTCLGNADTLRQSVQGTILYDRKEPEQ